MKLSTAALIAAMTLGFSGAAVAGNILVNPGFETGALSPWFNNMNFGGSDWTVTNSTSESGSFSATNFGNVELEQTFAGVPASEVTQFSFYMEDTAEFNAVYLLYTDGTVDDFVVSPSGSSFSFFDLTSDLDTSKTLDGIAFWGDSDGTTYLDDVTVDVSVPEPTVWSLMIVGVAALGLALRRSRGALAGAA